MPRLAPFVAGVAGALPAIALVVHARARGASGFPLDDAWIHLTYARTLAEHGSFSYFPGDPATAGSTSPLFTLVIAALWPLVRDGEPLALALGVAGYAGFLAALHAWARARLGSAAWAAAAVALVALDPRLPILAASGMETGMFLCALALAFHARLAGRPLALGAAAGLATWLRPEGLLLAGALAIDLALDRLRGPGRNAPGATRGRGRAAAAERASAPHAAPRDATAAHAAPAHARPSPWPALAAFAALFAGFVVFNRLTGGAWLPNTFDAKLAYYGARPRAEFLAEDVLTTFTLGGWLVLLPFALAGMAREAARLARGASGVARPEGGWAVALVLAYLVLLPYSHRFNRYLVPALPAVAVLALATLRDAAASRAVTRRAGARAPAALGAGVAAVALAAQAAAFAKAPGAYAHAVRYHEDRHVRTGRWLAEHTPPGAVVAAHDVGAIAYFSRRRVVDVVGLVDREVVPWIGRPGYTDSLAALFARRGVTHVAAYDEWLAVDNAPAAFTAHPEPEVMRVHPWIAGRTVLLDADVARRLAAAAAALDRDDRAAAYAALREVLAATRSSARAWRLLGVTLLRDGRGPQAEQAFARALALDPESAEARAGLAAARGRARGVEARAAPPAAR
uniref:Tetratricopeptide repeat protein n=1 Tax=Eiseniibacteriota bacterium TaxID=2212470 RepID=A0A832I6V7_UNCEI